MLATERHESRRIDNQLRGRSGRQGDPGRSKFYLSLQDDLMRIFGSERMDGMLKKLGLKEGEAIIHPWINKALEKAQKKVEARNFDIRKNLLKYDDVMNDQRKVIFEQRIELMDGENLSETVAEMRARRDRRRSSPATFPRPPMPSSGMSPASRKASPTALNLDLPVEDWVKEEGIDEDDIRERLTRGRRTRGRRPRRAVRPRHHGLCRALDRAADARPSVARASGQPRPSALGRRLPRLCPARPAATSTRARRSSCSRRMLGNLRQAVTAQLMRVELVRQAAEAPPPEAPEMFGHHIDGTTGEDDFGEGTMTLTRVEAAHRAGRRARSERPDDLGQGRPQRGLPLRLGQEVQALPRGVRVGLIFHQAVADAAR